MKIRHPWQINSASSLHHLVSSDSNFVYFFEFLFLINYFNHLKLQAYFQNVKFIYSFAHLIIFLCNILHCRYPYYFLVYLEIIKNFFHRLEQLNLAMKRIQASFKDYDLSFDFQFDFKASFNDLMCSLENEPYLYSKYLNRLIYLHNLQEHSVQSKLQQLLRFMVYFFSNLNL